MADLYALTDATKADEPRWTMMSVRLEPGLVRSLKIQAVLAGRSIRSIVAEALQEWIARHGRQF